MSRCEAIVVAGFVMLACAMLGCSSPRPIDSAFAGYGAGWACTSTGTSNESEAGVEPGPPNIIIVLTDDQGYGDVGCFGAQDLATPHLDRLATEGIQLAGFYSVANVCSPSRAALMTGSYPVRVGVTDVLSPQSSIGLNPQEVTLAELLKCRGYATAAIGKWHLGDRPTFLPTRQGFDEFFGLPNPNDEPPLLLLEGEEVIEHSPELSLLTRRYTERALDFISRNQHHPFFLYLAHTMPHVPLAVSDDFAGRSARGVYGDVIMEIDWSMGRVLDLLDELGLAGNTLVAFASDNGPWLLYGNHGGSAGALREGKMTTFEGGVRVPGIMRWPDRIRAGKVSQEVVTTMDLFPTIAEIAGVGLPPWTLDGRSILPLLESGPGAASPHDAVYFYNSAELQALRSGRWKLHLPHRYLALQRPGADGARGDDGWRELPLSLFDLAVDPGETVNLAAQYPDVARQLKAAAAIFDTDLKHNRRPVGERQ